MKLSALFILLSVLGSKSLGQNQSPSIVGRPPETVPQQRTEIFGVSLEKYKNKIQQSFRHNPYSKELDDGESISIKTDLVLDDVLVTERNGNIVTGLTKNDFLLTENEAPQTIDVFLTANSTPLPRSIVLVIDCANAQTPYLKKSIQAAKLIVDGLTPLDEMAIITVDVKIRADFTNDKALLKRALDSLQITNIRSGSGAEFGALLATLNEMFNTGDRRQIVIFQGDGNETLWLKTDKDAPYEISNLTREKSGMKFGGKMRDYGFNDVKESVERSRATIYSIVPGIKFLGFSEKEKLMRAKISFQNIYRSLGLDEKYLHVLTSEFQQAEAERQSAGQMAMSSIAELSGGFTSFLEKPEDAENIYMEIFRQINNRYVIGYYPLTQSRSGQRRTVKVEVRNHPEYIVTGRKTYLPQL